MTWIAPAVDRPSGPLTGPDRPILQGMLAWQRATFLDRCAGLTGAQLAEHAVPPSNLSLLGLVRHMAKVERIWLRERVAAQAYKPMFARKDADFEDIDPASAEEDYARLLEEIRLGDEAVADISLEHEINHGDTMSLRLIYIHLIGEYARHNGHADLLRERVDGRTGA